VEIDRERLVAPDVEMTVRPTAGVPSHRGRVVATPGSVVTIGAFFAMLRRRWLLVLVPVLICLLASSRLLTWTPKTYQADAIVQVTPAIATNGATLSSISTTTETKIVTSTSVALAAKKILKYPGSTTDLTEHVTVTSPLDSQVLDITFSSPTAEGAAQGANAFANAYLTYRTDTAEKELSERVTRTQTQVRGLQADLTSITGTSDKADTQRSLLRNQIQELQTQLNTYQTTVVTPGQLAGSAAVPTDPASPKLIIYLAAGLLLGLLIGLVAAVVRDRRDDRVRGVTDLEQALGAPVLAEAASTDGGSAKAKSLTAVNASRGAEADAYRTVTTTVTADLTGSRVVMLCATGSGKHSLVPSNLAATFAMQGLVTVLAAPGNALGPAREVLGIRGDEHAGSRAPFVDRLVPTAIDGLFVLSLGDEVSMGATFRANGDNLDEVLTLVDMVVLDGINIELPSSSLRLGQIAHEAVVVVYKNRSTRSDVAILARHLEQVRATVLGAILFSRRVVLRRGRKARKTDAHATNVSPVLDRGPASSYRPNRSPAPRPGLVAPAVSKRTPGSAAVAVGGHNSERQGNAQVAEEVSASPPSSSAARNT
jgi:capsular polysaccharide biosynthesis protein